MDESVTTTTTDTATAAPAATPVAPPSSTTSAARPADFCRGLLAALDASEGRRRRRKRDTTPDAIGLSIKRELLEAAVADDPAPEEFEGWLLGRCLAAGHGSGGVRAIALSIWDEWRLVQVEPSFGAWLSEGAPSDDRDDAGPSCPAARNAMRESP